MKNIKFFLIAVTSMVMLFACLTTPVKASPVPDDTTTAFTKENVSGLKISYPLTSIPGEGVSRYSTPFTIGDYNNVDFASRLINYTKILSSDTSKPHITTILQGSNDLISWDNLDTLGVVGDSAVTHQSGTLDLNSVNGSKHYYYYRLLNYGTADNPGDATAKEELIFTGLKQ